MITVRSLHIYPVKSCRGIDLDVAEITPTGFRHDRRWMLIGPDGRFLSQRTNPGLALVSTRIESGLLVLGAPGRTPLEVDLDGGDGPARSVTLWNDTCDAVGVGADAAEWFSSLLGTPCELVRQGDGEDRPVDARFSSPGDRVSFADGFPFLLVSQDSVNELNRRLTDEIPADRFRANIVIEGCSPHAEDGWSSIRIGSVNFRVAKPCARCVVVTTDQLDGGRSAEPLRTLAGYRRVDGKILFGQNLIHLGGGTLRVGDEARARPPQDGIEETPDSENSY